MTAPELPPTMQEFNEITAVIFARLFNAFPIPWNIPPEEVAVELGLADPRQQMPSGRLFKEVFASTMDWLIREEFIRAIGPLLSDGIVLTTKGMAALKIVPPSLSRPLGSELADATEQASTEAGKRKLTELIGEFFGSALGSFTKNISGG
jgi:hypothetical protein